MTAIIILGCLLAGFFTGLFLTLIQYEKRIVLVSDTLVMKGKIRSEKQKKHDAILQLQNELSDFIELEQLENGDFDVSIKIIK